MQWIHKCDYNWLRDRRNFLTATDIKDLLPVTKTGRPRTVTQENYLSVLARKHRTITEEECISTGAAARGHILEPYALDCFNAAVSIQYPYYPYLYHWDDGIIPKDEKLGSLAFSPDACDIKQEWPPFGDGIYLDVFPNVIGEVKSYSAEKHMLLGYKEPMELEERWQIATAMTCRDSIHSAYLILYNPSMAERLFIKKYHREDLKTEIETITDIESNWMVFINDIYPKMFHGERNINGLFANCGKSEKEIIEEINKSKSVIQ